jgi:two-component system, LytTR family, sensor kinase
MEIEKRNGFLKTIIDLLTGRLARNIYFWIFYFLNFFQNADEFKYGISTNCFLLLGFMAFIATAMYLNNLWLLPKFFKKKLYRAYFIRFSVMLVISASGLILFNYLFDKYFPLENFYHLNLISLDSRNLYTTLQNGEPILLDVSIGALLGMFVFYFFFFMAWFMNDYFVQQKKLEQAIKEKLQSDLALIKYQISPHFLFNTLNNLYGMSLIKSDNLPKSLLDLAGILRYILYESSTDKIPFEKEKEVLDAYIQLELLRLHQKENLSFTIKADTNYNLPPLLWLPILENIFKHATRQISKENYVDFKFIIEKGIVTIDSKNSYKPLAEKLSIDAKTNSGMGLQNLKKRLEISYEGKYEFIEKKEADFYSIFIKIDLNE